MDEEITELLYQAYKELNDRQVNFDDPIDFELLENIEDMYEE